ncbi:hypothetical protein [Streptomyces fradiae]|uniref:hypothetical protein n=1 Tax=Streptomyces fradiae TaxID=1906 RepID=UPI00351915AF
MEDDSTVMYRHFIAPSRGFTQFSHDLIRHPSLNSDAVRLLTWQLSLPEGARESLSRTAEKARIGACAFTRAKRQLKAAGFVHERRVQGPGGRWVTQQLVSNRPLSEAQAAKLLGRTPPSPVNPTVGEPTPRPTDGYPKDEHLGEDNSILPPEPDPEPEPTPDVPEEARAVVGTLPLLSPALKHIPPGMRDELARLAAAWLAAGHTSAAIHAHLLRGLPGGDTPVHRPGGLVRYLLRAIPPVAPPQPPPPTGPGISARLAETRECEGQHAQATLFRPVGDETLCRQCAEEAAGVG